jgi:hypothetical protein
VLVDSPRQQATLPPHHPSGSDPAVVQFEPAADAGTWFSQVAGVIRHQLLCPVGQSAKGRFCPDPTAAAAGWHQ